MVLESHKKVGTVPPVSEGKCLSCVTQCLKYRKFSNKGAFPNKGAPRFLRGTLRQNFTFLAISQPKMVRFSFCKELLEAENALYSAISLSTRSKPLLEHLRYFRTCHNTDKSVSIDQSNKMLERNEAGKSYNQKKVPVMKVLKLNDKFSYYCFTCVQNNQHATPFRLQ